MAEATLVTEKIEAADSLIRSADKEKVPLRAALWVRDAIEEVWRLVLEADPDSEVGPHEFSLKLHRAAAKIKNVNERNAAKALLLFDVTIVTQPDRRAEQLRRSPLGEAESVWHTRLSDVFLYRLDREQRLGPREASSIRSPRPVAKRPRAGAGRTAR